MENNITKDEKINASLVLASYLDTLGFNNGKWEFNSDYRFLQAIVEKTRSEVAPKYQK